MDDDLLFGLVVGFLFGCAFAILFMSMSYERDAKKKDRMMEFCVEQDAKYADCLAEWERK